MDRPTFFCCTPFSPIWRNDAMTSILKGNFETKKQVDAKEPEEDDLESRFEKEAMKRLGGSIAFVKKKKVKWNLNE